MTHKNRNKHTTNKEIVDMALCLHESAEYLQKVVMRTNMNSYFRDRMARLVQKLKREAINLGGDLDVPDSSALATLSKVQSIARQMGLIK